jgi:hypothetical protein
MFLLLFSQVGVDIGVLVVARNESDQEAYEGVSTEAWRFIVVGFYSSRILTSLWIGCNYSIVGSLYLWHRLWLGTTDVRGDFYTKLGGIWITKDCESLMTSNHIHYL